MRREPVKIAVIIKALSKLEGSTHLRIWVPHHNRLGKPFNYAPLLELVKATLTEISGGETTLAGRGRWLNGARASNDEPVDVVETYLYGSLMDSELDRIVDCLITIADAGDQDAVAIAIDKELFVVEGPFPKRGTHHTTRTEQPDGVDPQRKSVGDSKVPQRTSRQPLPSSPVYSADYSPDTPPHTLPKPKGDLQ